MLVEIAQIFYRQIASADTVYFTEEAQENGKLQSIQPGAYPAAFWSSSELLVVAQKISACHAFAICAFIDHRLKTGLTKDTRLVFGENVGCAAVLNQALLHF